MKAYEKVRTPNGTKWHLVQRQQYTTLCGVAVEPRCARTDDDGSRGDFCRACLSVPETQRLQKPGPV